jgi:hypothetical protein
MFMRACVLAGLAFSASAFGQISTTGPFTGDSSENFNALPFPVFVAEFSDLFDGSVDMKSYPAGSSGLHATGGWGFFSSIPARSAPRLVGGAGTNVEWVFNTPVARFGGYFGTNADVPGATITFFDVNNNQIGSTLDVNCPNTPTNSVEWAWNGWDSTVPIARALLIATNQFGGFIMEDDMELGFGSTGCEADFNGDNQVDFFDYLDFVAAFDAEDDSADFNGDNQVDFFDYLDFASAFDNCQ